MENQRFEALSRMCLNNWHYIQHKVLSFHEGINFFTGHSGSGKSTVIDAMQIVLYANTDGRGFFNKAAADDSDRSLIEYLRGMINIGEDEKFSYLRNQNFSSTIVLELQRTDTGERQCVGVVFDVETATNEIGRMFFWHKGGIPEHAYRTGGRVMSTEEVKGWLLSNYAKNIDCEYGSHNERFRKNLYDHYLGGLDAEKFPVLFKRAIPFRMNIKLEDFVKEYICTEQDIHIEDMQISVMEYGRMRRKIEDTCREMERLKEICAQYDTWDQRHQQEKADAYYAEKLGILYKRQLLAECADRLKAAGEAKAQSEQEVERLKEDIDRLNEQSDELLRRISSTGYEQLKGQLEALNENVEHLALGKARWEQTASRLKAWEDEECVSNQILWDIEKFVSASISEAELGRLKIGLADVQKEVSGQRDDAKAELRRLEKERKEAEESLKKLKVGGKAYPKELEQAKNYLARRLREETGKNVQVEILADLLDIRDEQWRNAVEGYLGNNKLALIVEPRYAKLAMEIYRQMDRQRYYRVAVLDTEKVTEDAHKVLPGALAEEVRTDRKEVRAYMDFQLGRVMKCDSIDELRRNRIGITRDCVLYHSYRLQHINPELYTTRAYIGKHSIRQRIRLLEKQIEELKELEAPQQELLEEAQRVLALESLSQDSSIYLEWKKDRAACAGKQREQERLKEKLEELRARNVDQLEAERTAIRDLLERQREVLRQQEKNIHDYTRDAEREQENQRTLNEELIELERDFQMDGKLEEALCQILEKEKEKGVRYNELQKKYLRQQEKDQELAGQEYAKLVDLRTDYLKAYAGRNFSATIQENKDYQELLDILGDERLEEFRKKAAEQAKNAVEHFKDDFMYKIRSAIKEAMQRKDELNRIISRLDFGKDKYQFVITKNKGADGQYYDMFMDDSLEINPSELNIGLDNQLNLFTIEHEKHYGALINDLISIFIPPENATAEELAQAQKNMERYADYRTYLSFDMQQIVRSEEGSIKIQLSRMIKKNSGGEGQNPLYVALLASFAQAYKIDLKPGLRRNPTIRLVVLDEAFSKMDAEKVASCIQLIRGLGFQALISATNDKIQNYLETVDKVFVFANPNKRAISIQEFEKKEFGQLNMEEDE